MPEKLDQLQQEKARSVAITREIEALSESSLKLVVDIIELLSGHEAKASWKRASEESVQRVKETIPPGDPTAARLLMDFERDLKRAGYDRKNKLRATVKRYRRIVERAELRLGRYEGRVD